ncbi:MAG: translation elongation factor Ts [Actinobacteria bacterium]|nr:translation elongation factor Ts [Actinomycetota bacterium]
MDIRAGLVKELRAHTGAPMMDCKRALQDASGDLEEAERLLRERGVAAAGKRAGRQTTEGRVLARVEERARGAIVAVGCETEPVSKNDEFRAFADRVLEAVWNDGREAADQLEDERVALVAKIGENVAVAGAARFETESGEVLASYIHPPAEKIGVLVRARATPELARLLAMHISFANPAYLTRDEVPEDEVARERGIYEKLPEVGEKPEHVRQKIVEGMLAKRFFAERVLADQQWIHDDSLTVGKALAEHGASVREFVRLTPSSGDGAA